VVRLVHGRRRLGYAKFSTLDKLVRFNLRLIQGYSGIFYMGWQDVIGIAFISFSGRLILVL